MYDRRYFSEIPSESPGLYALYDGHNGNKCVYVGKSVVVEENIEPQKCEIIRERLND